MDGCGRAEQGNVGRLLQPDAEHTQRLGDQPDSEALWHLLYDSCSYYTCLVSPKGMYTGTQARC